MLSGFIAAYAFRARQNEEIDLFGNGLFRDTTDTRAVFSEVTWKATPAVSVTMSMRYESEKRERTDGAGPFAIYFHDTSQPLLPRTAITLHGRAERRRASRRVSVCADCK